MEIMASTPQAVIKVDEIISGKYLIQYLMYTSV